MLFNPTTAYTDIQSKINTLLGNNIVQIGDESMTLQMKINQYLINKTMADPNTGV